MTIEEAQGKIYFYQKILKTKMKSTERQYYRMQLKMYVKELKRLRSE